MKSLTVYLPEAAIFGVTRALAGVGVGLLLANQLIAPERRKLGWSLLAVGALSTIPLAMRFVPRLRNVA